MVQLHFFLNMVFETMSDGVHIYLRKLFPKLVSFYLIAVGNTIFFLNRWCGKFTLQLKDPPFENGD